MAEPQINPRNDHQRDQERTMERNQRRQSRPGREHRPESSRRPHADEQETYRNPRNEYRDDDRGDDFELSQYGSREYRDRDFESDEANRYGASERGYGYGDRGYHDDARERYEPGYGARRQGRSRDSWAEAESGEFSEARSRWPRDDRYRSEPRSQNWPHSRAGRRVSEYGYFGDDLERPGYGERQQGGSRYGFGSRPERDWQEPPRGGVQFGEYGGQRQGGMEHGNRGYGEDYSGLGPRNYLRSDERIKEDICDELSADPECNAEDVEIEVKEGVVNLSGTVPSRKMKHRAEDIADAARGVKDIDNRIRVTGHLGRDRGERSASRQDENEGGSSSGRSRRGETKRSSRKSS
jgi:hypothetical protein